MAKSGKKRDLLLKDRESLVREYKTIMRKLRNPDYREKAVAYVVKEILHHHGKPVTLVLASRRTKFFLSLAKQLGKETRFKVLRSSLPLNQGQVILHVQEIAFGKTCLEEVRAKILKRKLAPTSRQMVPVAFSVVSSRTAIEIEGSPVISLNRGCPCCGTRPGVR